MITEIQLVPLPELIPAAYNPREADPDRLDLLKVSLQKLGFILPLFALRDGHLLSGHQRLEVARELGCTHVPVQYVDANPDALKGINILFNRRLEVSEPVATPMGWRPIGELRVGDEVFGADGFPHCITAVTPREVRQMYRVEFDDGTAILADEEHLWTVDYTRARNTKYLKHGTVTTGQVATMLSEHRRVAVPRIAPVSLPTANLPIDPWLMGMLLGDGNLTAHGVRLCSDRPDWCFEKVAACLPAGVEVRVDQTTHDFVKSIRFVGGSRGGVMQNPMVESLRTLGLAGLTAAHKFIPVPYLWGSADQRLALLQGLMDSDGCTGATGTTPIFTTISGALAEGVMTLVQSLGGKASRRVMRKAAGKWSETYQVTVRLPVGLSCFSHPDKIVKQRRDVAARLRRRIVSVTPDRAGEAVCISIDSDDHLYLARGFIPTHNCTNDMRSTDTGESLKQTLPLSELQALMEAVPDRDPADPGFHRCVNVEWLPLDMLLAMVTRRFETNAVGINRKLQHLGVHMPVVIDHEGRVINGSYRLMALAETKTTRLRMGTWPDTFPAVRLNAEEARLADLLLNMVSMKFTVEKQYADLLRWGAFRRQENKVSDLPQSFRILVNDWKATSAKEDLDDNEEFWQKFRREYGEKIVDFGAGQRRVKPLLAKKGIHCTEFEPYPCDWRNEMADAHPKDVPHLGLARRITDEFLADVAAKTPYSSVVLAAVMNSVPFHFDRMCVLAVCHALCNFGGQIVGQARAPENTSSVNYLKNRTDASGHHLPAPSTFLLDYEPNITLGNVGRAPKVQRAHSPAELREMLGKFFESVQVQGTHNYVWFRAQHPKRVSPGVLAKAIRHEFDLPWQSGERLGRVEQALDAFSRRLGVDLRKHA